MDKFIEKWKNDNKFRAKIKLLLYGIFIVIVTIYAASLNPINNIDNEDIEETSENINTNVIPKVNNYNYRIKIDDDEYWYYIKETDNKKEIVKEINGEKYNYLYEDNNYYKEVNNNYIKININEVYDILEYSYLDIDNINSYLEKAENNGQEYLVYLKDVILSNETNDYFVILINDKQISIDYTPLLKEIKHDNKNYHVWLTIEE
jgi:hypothetical protein